MNRRLAICLFASLSLGACVLSPAAPEPFGTYSLDPAPAASRGEKVAFQLSIDAPIAPDPIAGAPIAVRDTDRAYGVLRGARWSERTPELVRSALLRAFEDSGRIRGVVRSASGVRSDYRLLLELRSFEADYSGGGAPVAKISVSAKLVRTAGAEVISARVLADAEPAKEAGVASIVAAFDRAGGRMIPELCDWVLQVGQADWASRRGSP